MRSFFLLYLLFILSAISSFSQIKTEEPISIHPYAVRALKAQQQTVTKQKTTAVRQRVIAQTERSEPGSTPVDSVSWSYSGANSSEFDFNFMNFPIRSFFANTTLPFDYNLPELPSDVEYDTMSIWKVSSNNTLKLHIRHIKKYNSNHQIKTKIEKIMDGIDDTLYVHYSYDSIGRMSEVLLTLNYFYSPSDTITLFRRFYDANNLLIADTVYYNKLGSHPPMWSPYHIYHYTYNNTLLDSLSHISYSFDSMQWYPTELYLHTHDALGRLASFAKYTGLPGDTLRLNILDSFEYTGSNMYFTNCKEYQYDSIGKVSALNSITKHLDAQQLPDTIRYNSFDFTTSAWNTFSIKWHNTEK